MYTPQEPKVALNMTRQDALTLSNILASVRDDESRSTYRRVFAGDMKELIDSIIRMLPEPK